MCSYILSMAAGAGAVGTWTARFRCWFFPSQLSAHIQTSTKWRSRSRSSSSRKSSSSVRSGWKLPTTSSALNFFRITILSSCPIYLWCDSADSLGRIDDNASCLPSYRVRTFKIITLNGRGAGRVRAGPDRMGSSWDGRLRWHWTAFRSIQRHTSSGSNIILFSCTDDDEDVLRSYMQWLHRTMLGLLMMAMMLMMMVSNAIHNTGPE